MTTTRTMCLALTRQGGQRTKELPGRFRGQQHPKEAQGEHPHEHERDPARHPSVILLILTKIARQARHLPESNSGLLAFGGRIARRAGIHLTHYIK